MKVTKTHLRRIIKEERAKLQLEQVGPMGNDRMEKEMLTDRMASALYELFVSELSFKTEDISPEQEGLYPDWDQAIDFAGDEFRSLLLSSGVLASVVDVFAEAEVKLFDGQAGQ
jgi:hypothetical protein